MQLNASSIQTNRAATQPIQTARQIYLRRNFRRSSRTGEQSTDGSRVPHEIAAHRFFKHQRKMRELRDTTLKRSFLLKARLACPGLAPT